MAKFEDLPVKFQKELEEKGISASDIKAAKRMLEDYWVVTTTTGKSYEFIDTEYTGAKWGGNDVDVYTRLNRVLRASCM